MMDKYQVMPPLSDDEYQALKEDIRANGVLVDIVRDEHGNVIDGYHRSLAVGELFAEGWTGDVPVETVSGLSEDEKIELAYTLNTHRRQLPKEWKQAEACRLRERGWTQQRIAGVLGIPQQTLSRWFSELTQMGKLTQPETIVGADGKERKASYDRQPEPEPEELCNESEASGSRPMASAPDVPVDDADAAVDAPEADDKPCAPTDEKPSPPPRFSPRDVTDEEAQRNEQVKDRWDRFIYLVFYAKKVDPSLVTWLYRNLAREFHPDKHRQDAPELQERCSHVTTWLVSLQNALPGTMSASTTNRPLIFPCESTIRSSLQVIVSNIVFDVPSSACTPLPSRCNPNWARVTKAQPSAKNSNC